MPGELTNYGAMYGCYALTGNSGFGQGNLALFTAATALTSGGAETNNNIATNSTGMTEVFTPGTNGYSRPALTFGAPTGNPPTTVNSNQVTFGPFTAAPAAPITHAALVSGPTGSHRVIMWWTYDRTITAGETLTFMIGDITFSVTQAAT